MVDFVFKVLVKEVYSNDFVFVNENTDLNAAVEFMLRRNRQEIFLHDDKNNLSGLLTMKDIALIKNYNLISNLTVKNFMTKDIVSVTLEHSIKQCRDMMIERKIGRLAVVEDGKFIGVISEKEVRDFYYMKMEYLLGQLEYLVDHSYEAICIIDTEGVVYIWNKSAEELYDLPAEEIVGKHISGHFPNAMGLKVLKTQKPIKNALHHPRESSYVIINAFPIYINGELTGVVTTDRDVTEINNLAYNLEKANEAILLLENQIKEISNDNFGKIIGKSEKINQKIKVAKQVAPTDASILITGESGTGKELFARAIHEYSGRTGMFVPVNCSSVPSELFESEMFGYVEGAFTGARKKGKVGLFELSNEGTIFLDEIGDMPMHMQAKLLRVLQEQEVRRIGDEKSIPINIRVISATNKDLGEMVAKELFRDDLYYRLKVVNIELPPLRERRHDIVILIKHFLKEMAEKNNRRIPEIDMEAMEALRRYPWKGNIRELKNAMEYLVVLTEDGDRIAVEMLPENIRGSLKTEASGDEKEIVMDLNRAIRELERERITMALDLAEGNKKKAAGILKIPRATLYYKMEQYNL